jgi:hypothetical protein
VVQHHIKAQQLEAARSLQVVGLARVVDVGQHGLHADQCLHDHVVDALPQRVHVGAHLLQRAVDRFE